MGDPNEMIDVFYINGDDVAHTRGAVLDWMDEFLGDVINDDSALDVAPKTITIRHEKMTRAEFTALPEF